MCGGSKPLLSLEVGLCIAGVSVSIKGEDYALRSSQFQQTVRRVHKLVAEKHYYSATQSLQREFLNKRDEVVLTTGWPPAVTLAEAGNAVLELN